MYRVVPSHTSSPQVQLINNHEKLSRWQHTTLWVFMMLLHAVCSAFLLTSAKLYWLMENEYLNYFAGLLAPERDRHFHVIGVALGGLGAVHGLQFFSHFGNSTFARQLKARPLNVGSTTETCLRIIVRKLIRLWQRTVNRSRIPQNVESHSKISRTIHRHEEGYYSRLFAFRKMMEIATQVPNGYLYSTLLARSWINHAKVSLLIVNCWYSFIHLMLLRSDPDGKPAVPVTPYRTSVRFAALIVDAILATATAIILPSAIILPYALQFDFKDLNFPDSMLYGDTAFPNLVLENRAFFFMSWANSVMKIVSHISVFLCLEAIASMLHTPSQPDQTTPTDQLVHKPPQTGSKLNRTIVASASYRALLRAYESVHSSAHILNRVQRVTIPTILLATGGVVLGLHLSAQYGSVSGDIAQLEGMCLQRMHPWFASNFSCAVVKYNCYKENVTSPSLPVFSWLEREAVRRIIFMHCSEFVMPPIIREFPSLMGVELWNTTLVEWGKTSAVSAELHPMMLFIYLVYVNMTGVPPGIMQSPLPELLTDLEFIHTNLTTIPEHILDPWNGIQIVYIEHSKINKFPSELMQLPALSELSLIDNQVETIPEDTFLNGASTYFFNLAFSKNPLQKLPPARSDNFYVSYLALEFTQLTEVPAWIGTNVWDAVSLGGTPLCQANSSAKLAGNVLCGQNADAWDPLGDERYPTQLIAPFRSLEA